MILEYPMQGLERVEYGDPRLRKAGTVPTKC